MRLAMTVTDARVDIDEPRGASPLERFNLIRAGLEALRRVEADAIRDLRAPCTCGGAGDSRLEAVGAEGKVGG